MVEPEVEVTVNEPEETPEVVLIAPPAETGAVDDALALVEHVEEDVDKWVDNGREHEAMLARIAALEAAQVVEAVEEVAEAAAEVAEAEAVEEVAEEIVEAEAEGDESEVENDVPPVEEEPIEHPARAWDDWDYFKSAHAEGE
jgi:hypothetical protein